MKGFVLASSMAWMGCSGVVVSHEDGESFPNPGKEVACQGQGDCTVFTGIARADRTLHIEVFDENINDWKDIVNPIQTESDPDPMYLDLSQISHNGARFTVAIQNSVLNDYIIEGSGDDKIQLRFRVDPKPSFGSEFLTITPNGAIGCVRAELADGETTLDDAIDNCGDPQGLEVLELIVDN